MKGIISFICLLSFSFLFAQSPQKMSFQAVVRNAQNQLVQNANVGIKISILESSSNGTVVFSETHVPITNENGIFTIEIGNGTLMSGDFSQIFWSTNSFWLKTELDPLGGNNYTISTVSQFLSVPYALHSKSAESLINDPNNFTHHVGELFGGGVIFYVYKDLNNIEHGLIVSLNDLASQISWGLSGTDVANCESSWDG